MTASYEELIESKSRTTPTRPVPHGELAEHLFPFQADLVRWALRIGRAAIFADCGLGKTACLLEWSRHVSTHGRVLIVAPLGVAHQIVREGNRFGVPAVYLRADDRTSPIVVTNYEMLEHFDADAFVGVVCDESGILKSYSGATRNLIIEMFRETRWKLACTATPAPNDWTELGNHAEFLGAMSRVEMLSEFFAHDGGSTQDWRLKGHAIQHFWTWVSGWGAVIRTPAALGYDDSSYRLPALHLHDHVLRIDQSVAWATGALFVADARSLNEQRAVRRETIDRRVEAIAALVAAEPHEQWLLWADYNLEADALEESIPHAVQVSGSNTVDEKCDRLLAFGEGRIKVLVSKCSIAGHGLNYQSCARMAFMGPSHSYEQVYQAIRRCWRFGQTRPVHVHVICAENEQSIVQNMRRKEADADRMAAEMQSLVGPAMRAAMGATEHRWNPYNPSVNAPVPSWLLPEAHR